MIVCLVVSEILGKWFSNPIPHLLDAIKLLKKYMQLRVRLCLVRCFYMIAIFHGCFRWI